MKPARNIEGALPKRIANYALSFILTFSLIAIGSLTFLANPVFALSVTSFPAPLPQGQVGSAYSATLTASGTAPYTWGAPIGLPTGLSLTAAGDTAVISGTPTAAGTFAFQIQVQDAAPATFTFNSTIIINPPPFTITTSSIPQGKEGTSYSTNLSASGGTTPYTWGISSGSLPSGLTLSTTSGYINFSNA